MGLTPQSGFITSHLSSPNPEEEINFEPRVPLVESNGVKSKQFVFPHPSKQMIPVIFRSITYIPAQMDNLAENAKSNTLSNTKSKHLAENVTSIANKLK